MVTDSQRNISDPNYCKHIQKCRWLSALLNMQQLDFSIDSAQRLLHFIYSKTLAKNNNNTAILELNWCSLKTFNISFSHCPLYNDVGVIIMERFLRKNCVEIYVKSRGRQHVTRIILPGSWAGVMWEWVHIAKIMAGSCRISQEGSHTNTSHNCVHLRTEALFA